MLIILILTSSSFCQLYDLVHLRQKSFRSSVSSAGNSVWSSLLLGDWDFQVGNIFGVTICLENDNAPGFVSDESSSLWFLEELSRNEEPSRWIPDLLWTHDLRQFWRFCGMESRSKHKIVAKGSRLRVAHPPPEGPGPPRSPRHLLRTGFPHRRRFSQLFRIHYNFHNIQMSRCEGFLLLQNTTCFEADLGADSENA